jgi:hypothetical protein
MQDEHGGAERRDEDDSVGARERAVRGEEGEWGSREGCRHEELPRQTHAKWHEDCAQPSDAQGDECRATEKRAGSRSWKSGEVCCETSRNVLDL